MSNLEASLTRLAVLTSAIALAAAAPKHGQGVPALPANGLAAPAQTAEQDQIGIAYFTWGKLLLEWMVYSDGSGFFKESHQRSNSFWDYVVVTKQWSATPGLYQQITELLRGAEPSLDFGCDSTKAEKVYDQIHEADNLIMNWAADAIVVDDSKPRSPKSSG